MNAGLVSYLAKEAFKDSASDFPTFRALPCERGEKTRRTAFRSKPLTS